MCFAVSRPGIADELKVTFIFTEGTSMHVSVAPLCASALVYGKSEAGGTTSCASGTIVMIHERAGMVQTC